MQVVFAKYGGFCSGVKRAVDTAMRIEPENTYIYGEIIHNRDVVDEIEKRGIKTVNDLSEVPDGARLIIRSHGAGKAVFEECARRNIEAVDCTCAFVRRTQHIVKEKSAEGKTIVIVGERTHPEVIGITGWCENGAHVISSEEDDFGFLEGKDCCVVAQTTFSEEKFEKIIKNLRDKRGKTVEVFKTICYTTVSRQNEARKLAAECDAILVIGGLNSSNTGKLYDICKEHCENVFRLKNAEDCDYTKLKSFKKVGVVTGASTPNEQTQEVLLKMVMETADKATMEEVVANMDNQQKFKKGDIVKATISTADDQGVSVLLPMTKKEILLDKNEVDCETYDKEAFNSRKGDEIELMVVDTKPVKLSQKRIKEAKEEEAMLEGIKEGQEFSITCTGSNKGGLTGQLGSYKVFVPAREIRSGYVKELDKYVGKKLRLKLLEINTEKGKEIVASQRVIIEAEKAAREAEKAAKEAEFFANVHVDDIVEGKVERVTGFGAFVSVNGFDCLARISDISWGEIDSVTDVLEIGKTYQFKVLRLDPESKKAAIGYKQLQPHPWDLVGDKYVEGDVIHGKVVRIVPFGAFVEVEKGIDGLVHVSQISHEFLENPTTALTIGQEIDAKILRLNPEERKMTLSIKALLPRPEREDKKDDEKGGKKSSRIANDPDEMTSWTDDNEGGASIADLMKNN